MKLRSKIVFIKSLIVFMALSLTGCEDVIHVDLETGEDRLVVDAEIFWQKGTDGSQQKITAQEILSYLQNRKKQECMYATILFRC